MIKNLKNKKKKGFTLIELIIVIAILAILAAIAVPQFGKIRANANKNADLSNAKTIHSAVSALIASEEITLTKGSAKIVLPNNKASIKGTTDANATALKAYLETIPVPKAIQKSAYAVNITTDENGVVKTSIAAVSGEDYDATNEIYPTPATNSIYGK